MHLTTAYREKCGLAQKRVLVVSSFQGGGHFSESNSHLFNPQKPFSNGR